MSFTYTQIKDQALDSINHLIVRGYYTGTGVECNVYVRNDMRVDKNVVKGESSQSNFFIEGATVSSLTSDLSAGFITLYQHSTDDRNNAKRIVAGAQITQGVIVCPYSITTLRGSPAIAFDEQSYLLPGATIEEDVSGTSIVGGGAGSVTDANAIHKGTASEIHGIALKASPVGADEIVIEDSAATWAKKRVAISTLPTSGGGQTDTVAGSNGITNTGTNVNATLAPTYGTSVNTFCQGNDSRLSDSRTPTSHASSHSAGGADAVKLDDLAAPDDNTDLNASVTKHGLLQKLGGGTTNFLRADGSWAAPPSGGGGYQLIPITTNENTDQSSDMVVGALGITGASFGSATVKFVATAFVADSGLTGTVTLYNLTDASAEAALSFTELVSTHKASSGLTLDSGAKMYEVRIKVTGGSVPADVISCMWAGIELS